MGQIADNLSAAIYGDPRDELVREQITNAQHTRTRQQQQDQMELDDKNRKQQALDELAGTLGTGGDISKAIPSFIQSGGNLADAFYLMGVSDPRHQQRRDLQGQSHELGMVRQNDAQSHAAGMQANQYDLMGQRDERLQGYEESNAGLAAALRLAGGMGQAEHDSLIRKREFEGGYGGGARTERPRDISPSDVHQADIYTGQQINSLYGENASAEADPRLLRALTDRAMELYKESGNFPQAMQQARSELIADDPGEVNRWNEYPRQFPVQRPPAEGPQGTPITSGQFAGMIKGDDGAVYDQQGVPVARWR
jgi:hypothetical protein